MKCLDIRVVCILLVTTLASAAQPVAGGISWTYQQIDPDPQSPSPSVALAMSTGAKWPKVFYEKGGSYPGYLAAASLKPLLPPGATSNWSITNLGTVESESSYVSAASGPDGRVGVSWRNGHVIQFAQYAGSGWQSSTVATIAAPQIIHRPSMTYGTDNRPLVAYTDNQKTTVASFNSGHWDHDSNIVSELGYGFFPSVAVDSQGQIAMVYRRTSGNCFATMNRQTGVWAGVDIGSLPSYANYSLAFAPNDQPAFTFLHDQTLEFASFNTTSGQWQINTIATDVLSERVNLVFNSQGHAALAFVDNTDVHYMINDGGGWVDHQLATSSYPAISDSDAALAFDYDDQPVIAYHSYEGLILAYDPFVAPEPASLLLLATGMIIMANRRRKRG